MMPFMAGKIDLQLGERKLLGPDLVQITIEKIHLIWERLKTSQSRQTHYADKRRQELEFQAGDHVFLKVLPDEKYNEIWEERKA